jgi:hypothetical protein
MHGRSIRWGRGTGACAGLTVPGCMPGRGRDTQASGPRAGGARERRPAGRAGARGAPRQAFDALPPGGALVAVDCVIDDARRANRWGLYLSLGMLAEFGGENAFDYTFAEFEGWASEVGYARAELIPLGGPASAAVAYKAA